MEEFHVSQSWIIETVNEVFRFLIQLINPTDQKLCGNLSFNQEQTNLLVGVRYIEENKINPITIIHDLLESAEGTKSPLENAEKESWMRLRNWRKGLRKQSQEIKQLWSKERRYSIILRTFWLDGTMAQGISNRLGMRLSSVLSTETITRAAWHPSPGSSPSSVTACMTAATAWQPSPGSYPTSMTPSRAPVSRWCCRRSIMTRPARWPFVLQDLLNEQPHYPALCLWLCLIMEIVKPVNMF